MKNIASRFLSRKQRLSYRGKYIHQPHLREIIKRAGPFYITVKYSSSALSDRLTKIFRGWQMHLSRIRATTFLHPSIPCAYAQTRACVCIPVRSSAKLCRQMLLKWRDPFRVRTHSIPEWEGRGNAIERTRYTINRRLRYFFAKYLSKTRFHPFHRFGKVHV